MYLDPKPSTLPAAAVDAVKLEILHMGELTRTMLASARKAFVDNDSKMIGEVEELEKAVNDINRSVASYASEIWQRRLSSELSTVLGSYVNGVGDIERIGDHATNLMEMYEYKVDNSVDFSDGHQEFLEMYDAVETLCA